MARALLVLALLALLGYGGCALWRGQASDETKIRREIEAMIEALHATEVAPIMNRLTEDFREEERGAGKEEARYGLAAWLREARDPASGKLRYRVAPDWSSWRYVPDSEHDDRAEAVLHAQVFEGRGAGETLIGEVRIASAWVRGGPWRCRRARLETVSGRPPFH
ncbi:MAG: hypothetical protein EYC70_03055 [Planctomycetota bacterium]|nr:MAG: hypothetical protein EYC70_03055 [Planctomycetota bacterium]